jgi:hypothetical protein
MPCAMAPAGLVSVVYTNWPKLKETEPPLPRSTPPAVLNDSCAVAIEICVIIAKPAAIALKLIGILKNFGKDKEILRIYLALKKILLWSYRYLKKITFMILCRHSAIFKQD